MVKSAFENSAVNAEVDPRRSVDVNDKLGEYRTRAFASSEPNKQIELANASKTLEAQGSLPPCTLTKEGVLGAGDIASTVAEGMVDAGVNSAQSAASAIADGAHGAVESAGALGKWIYENPGKAAAIAGIAVAAVGLEVGTGGLATPFLASGAAATGGFLTSSAVATGLEVGAVAAAGFNTAKAIAKVAKNGEASVLMNPNATAEEKQAARERLKQDTGDAALADLTMGVGAVGMAALRNSVALSKGLQVSKVENLTNTQGAASVTETALPKLEISAPAKPELNIPNQSAIPPNFEAPAVQVSAPVSNADPLRTTTKSSVQEISPQTAISETTSAKAEGARKTGELSTPISEFADAADDSYLFRYLKKDPEATKVILDNPALKKYAEPKYGTRPEPLSRQEIETTLNREERDGLGRYSKCSFAINESIRNGRPNSETVAMIAGLKRLPAIEDITYRGAKIPPHDLDNYLHPGSIIQEPAFFSTSQCFNVAKHHAMKELSMHNDWPKAIFVVRGSTGRAVENGVSAFHTSEREVLFNTDSRFRIDGAVKRGSDGVHLIFLEDVTAGHP